MKITFLRFREVLIFEEDELRFRKRKKKKRKRKEREEREEKTVLSGAIAFILGTCVARTYHDISYLGAVGELLRLTAYVYVRYVMPLIRRYSVAEKRGDGDATAGERLGRKIHSYKSDCSTGCDGFSNPVISTMTILRFLVIVSPFFPYARFTFGRPLYVVFSRRAIKQTDIAFLQRNSRRILLSVA